MPWSGSGAGPEQRARCADKCLLLLTLRRPSGCAAAAGQADGAGGAGCAPTLPVALRCEGWQSWLQEIDPEIEAIVDIITHMAEDPAPSEDTFKYWEETLRDLGKEVKDSNPPPAFTKYAVSVREAASYSEITILDLPDDHMEFQDYDRTLFSVMVTRLDQERKNALADCLGG